MEFYTKITIEIDRVDNGLSIQTPVELQFVYRKGQWQAQCENPQFKTLFYDTLEEALVTTGKRVSSMLQPEAIEEPHIIGKITPDDFQ